jgi:hypothetical protein
VRWHTSPTTGIGSSHGEKSLPPLGRVAAILQRLEPVFRQAIAGSPAYSRQDKKRLVGNFRDLHAKVADGYARHQQIQEGVEPEKSDHKMTDIQLEVRLEGCQSDLLNFVSLGLNAVERLYLLNHMSDETYTRYKRTLRHLPQIHDDLVRRLNSSR